MKNLYGTIGYTVLTNTSNNNKIIIFADRHDELPKCPDKINMADWFKSKINSSKILLEEVPREDLNLEELWTDSPHTQELKNLYIKNPDIIQAVDIRPFLIPYSWELINKINDTIILKDYLRPIDNFYCLKLKYLINKLPIYNLKKLIHTKLGKHFLTNKRKYKSFLNQNINQLSKNISEIYQNDLNVLIQINTLLDDIMEWYICACIYNSIDKPIIIHTGLAHSEKVIRYLLLTYDYIIVERKGINNMKSINNKLEGCVQLSPEIEKQFGGFN